MKRNSLIAIGFSLWMLYPVIAAGQTEYRPWEKLGLSQSEWKLVQENKISERKVQELLSAGISISEYVGKPWKRFSMSERVWLEKRRAGLTQYDIELEANYSRSSYRGTGTSKGGPPSEYGAYSSGKNAMISFVLPGFQQFRLDQNVRGGIMGALAVGSLATCFLASMLEGKFEAKPLYFVLAPDMLWSFIDFKITLSREKE